MEIDFDLADRLEEFVNEHDDYAPKCDKKGVDIKQGEGNIVHLSFKTDTKGNA